MVKKNTISTILFLFNLSLQLDASQPHEKLTSVSTSQIQEQPQIDFDGAIARRDKIAVQALVSMGASLHNTECKEEFEKTTPLYSAIQQYDRDCDNNHPFHSPSIKVENAKFEQESLAIVDYLLNEKIGINAPGAYQQTPIYRAINDRMVTITKRLISAQADLTVVDQFHRTPLDVAKQNAMKPFNPKQRKIYYEICTMLEQAGAPSSMSLSAMPSDEIMQKEHKAQSGKFANPLKWKGRF